MSFSLRYLNRELGNTPFTLRVPSILSNSPPLSLWHREETEETGVSPLDLLIPASLPLRPTKGKRQGIRISSLSWAVDLIRKA